MRIAVIGGSVGGLFAAVLLRQAGHDVIVLERSRGGLAGRGAGLVAQEEVYRILASMGRPEVAAVGVVARDRITLDRAGTVVDRQAHPQTQMSWDALYTALRDAFGDEGYRLDAQVSEVHVSEAEARIGLADGSSVVADLVIGADGIGSTIRKSFVQVLPGPRYAGYVAWRFLLPEEDLPVAAELLSGRFSFFHMPGGQALGYLVAGPAGETAPGARRYNCVWYRQVNDLPTLLTDRHGRRHPFSLAPGAVADDVRGRLVEEAAALLPAQFAAVVAAEPSPFVQAIFDMETPTMTEGPLALLGDAAFVVRPHTAMGVAKAAGDAMALASALAEHPLERALASYDVERRRVGKAIANYGRRLGASLG